MNKQVFFLSNNDLLYNYQSGFRKTTRQTRQTCQTPAKILKGFDKGLMTGIILVDLQKAFDTSDHDILLKKFSAIVFQIILLVGSIHTFLIDCFA